MKNIWLFCITETHRKEDLGREKYNRSQSLDASAVLCAKHEEVRHLLEFLLSKFVVCSFKICSLAMLVFLDISFILRTRTQ